MVFVENSSNPLFVSVAVAAVVLRGKAVKPDLVSMSGLVFAIGPQV